MTNQQQDSNDVNGDAGANLTAREKKFRITRCGWIIGNLNKAIRAGSSFASNEVGQLSGLLASFHERRDSLSRR